MHFLEREGFRDRCKGAGWDLCAFGVLLLYNTMILEPLIIMYFSFLRIVLELCT